MLFEKSHYDYFRQNYAIFKLKDQLELVLKISNSKFTYLYEK